MKRNVNLTLVIFIFLSIIIFANNRLSILSSFSNVIQKTFSNSKSVLFPFKFISGSNSGDLKELARLKDENKKLLEKFVDYEKMKKDNVALRSQFEENEIKPQNLITSQIVGFYGRYDFPNSFIINKGEVDGLKIGMAVISGRNLVGKIQKVSGSFSKVILPTSKEFSILGKALSSSAAGVLFGEDDFIIFDKVVITDTLTKDDVIVTKGEVDSAGIGIPPNIIVGKISSINKVENKPFQNAEIKSFLDFSKLETVFVVKNIE